MSTHTTSATATIDAPRRATTTEPQEPTDAELLRSVRVRLSRLGARFLRGIQPTVRTGIVTLRGQVETDYERQVVVQLVQQIAGVRDVFANLRLAEPVSPPSRQQLEPTSGVTVRRFPIRRKHAVAAALASLLAATAWSAMDRTPVVPVKGTLRVFGQSGADVLLTLHPIFERGGNAPRPRGRVDASGRIEWTTFERGDGLPPGEYAVTAVWNRTADGNTGDPSGVQAIAACYARPETSPLRITVTDDECPPIELELMP
jgi:hypothetical protein